MSRRTSPLAPACLTAIALLAAGPLLHADNPPAPAAPVAPPGCKIVYHDVGGGKKVPIIVQNQLDLTPLVRHMEDDPLDHEKVFSETNSMANKAFLPNDAAGWDKNSNPQSPSAFATKRYNSSALAGAYNTGSKPTFHTASYDGARQAPGYDQTFATRANSEQNEADSEFAAIGSPYQSRTAPVDATPFATQADPYADKKFVGPEEDARHRHLTRLPNGQLLVDDLPDRPLSIDEVKNLINHGFKADTTQPPAPASKPLNDPDYKPEPLRISPAEGSDDQDGPAKPRVNDDDANDPIPSPGAMADPPENSEPLPSK